MIVAQQCVSFAQRGLAGSSLIAKRPSAVIHRATVSKRSFVRASAEKNESAPPATTAATPSSVKMTELPTAAAPAAPAATPRASGMNLYDAMSFSGPGPEIINARLSMLGFLAAVGAELSSGQTVAAQFSHIPGPMIFVVALLTTASLIPVVKEGSERPTFGPFTAGAELLNGRAAMIGFAALLAVESIRGTALF